MARFKIVVTDSPFPDSSYFKKGLGDLDCDFTILPLDTPREEVYRFCHDADGLIITFFDTNDDFLSSLDHCKVVSRVGIGMNNVDVDSCTKNNIYAVNVRYPQTKDVANHACALMLACAKKLPQLNTMTHSGKWGYKEIAPIYTLTNKTLGLWGCGLIGRHVAARMKGFEMNVISYDPFVDAESMAKLGIRKVDLDEFLATSDFISLHMKHTPDTDKIVNAEAFAKMKPTAILINTSRGGLVDEAALIDALNNGKIAAAGLDVLTDEYPTPDNPIFACPNCLITPHTAWYSEECQNDLLTEAAANVVDALTVKELKSLVNTELLNK